MTALTACGDDGETDTSGTDETEESAPASIPEGTTLRFGDQAGLVQLMLNEAGEMDDLPYTIEFVDFMGGPPINEAFAAGEIDVANLVDTPAVQNQAADLDTVVIGATQYDGTGAAIYATADSGIESVEDLPGNEVAYTQASMYHGFVLMALDSVGADESDIEPVDVPITDLAATIGRDADAGVIAEHAQPGFLAANPDAVEVATYSDLNDITQFLLATSSAVEDPAKSAALEDFLGRFARATDWVAANTDSFVETYYIGSFNLEPEAAAAVADAIGQPSVVEVSDELQENQQRLADLFHESGAMPGEVDMAGQFDPEVTERFNAALAESGSSAGDPADDGAAEEEAEEAEEAGDAADGDTDDTDDE